MDTNFLAGMDNKDIAIKLAAIGWYVFPCWPSDGPGYTAKAPRISKADGGTGWHDATTDHDKIYTWWKAFPGALVGIACAPSGLLVLDLDRHEGQPDGVAAYKELADDTNGGPVFYGPSQGTPGNGQHLIFKAPKIPENFDMPGKLAPGIDIRYRGYICTGRLSDGRSYEWLPGHGFDTPLIYPPGWIARIIVQLREKATESKEQVKRPVKPGELSPGDDFATRTDWSEILPPGWRRSGRVGDVEYWTRPGKRAGVSATVNYSGKENLYIFSTNASPFEPEKSYSKFAAYTLLKHNGDFTAAARALVAAGFGKSTN